MTFFRTPGFLSALRVFVVRDRRDSSRGVRTVTVPAPLAGPAVKPLIIDAPRPAELSAARAAAAARVNRGPLQTQRNKVLLSRRA